MKKLVCAALSICLLLSASAAFALDYKQHFDNNATFETLKEAHTNGALYMSLATGRTYMPDPSLDSYPDETTCVYRSARMYTCLSAANRMNTTILLYSDKSFNGKEAALSYIKSLGLTDIIDKAYGSVVLVTPIDKKGGFGAADQYAYYQLQSAMANIDFSKKVDDKTTVYYADGPYLGGQTYRYLIGVDGGATFLNNYVASTFDYVSRIAGMLLVNGKMEKVRKVASSVPVYLVNASDEIVGKYKEANGTNASGYERGFRYYFNQAKSLEKVVVNQDAKLGADLVSDVYDTFFIKAMRIPVLKAGLNAASTVYNNYSYNQAPYSLCERNAIIDGRTKDGINVIEHKEDSFKSIATKTGEYIQTWFEILPDEVLNNTAQAGTVPLWLSCHGGGDDPVQFTDEIGLLKLAGEERFAMVAPAYQNVYSDSVVCGKAMCATVEMMLKKYPALDASRVYVTGYSMGGGTAVTSFMNDVRMFAAAIPMAAGSLKGTDDQIASLNKYGLAFMQLTSFYDPVAFNAATGTPKEMVEINMNAYLRFNKINRTIDKFDYATYPVSGYKADRYIESTLNGEYTNKRWFFLNEEGAPLVGFCFTDDLIHALYPEYGYMAWDFAKHFSRDKATGKILYTPFVK